MGVEYQIIQCAENVEYDDVGAVTSRPTAVIYHIRDTDEVGFESYGAQRSVSFDVLDTDPMTEFRKKAENAVRHDIDPTDVALPPLP